MNVRVEFLVEPFAEGSPGAHVSAAVEAFARRGIAVDVGPFGNSAEGPPGHLLEALAAAMEAGLDAGASRITVHVSKT